jgi:hypothetical protein
MAFGKQTDVNQAQKKKSLDHFFSTSDDAEGDDIEEEPEMEEMSIPEQRLARMDNSNRFCHSVSEASQHSKLDTFGFVVGQTEEKNEEVNQKKLSSKPAESSSRGTRRSATRAENNGPKGRKKSRSRSRTRREKLRRSSKPDDSEKDKHSRHHRSKSKDRKSNDKSSCSPERDLKRSGPSERNLKRTSSSKAEDLRRGGRSSSETSTSKHGTRRRSKSRSRRDSHRKTSTMKPTDNERQPERGVRRAVSLNKAASKQLTSFPSPGTMKSLLTTPKQSASPTTRKLTTPKSAPASNSSRRESSTRRKNRLEDADIDMPLHKPGPPKRATSALLSSTSDDDLSLDASTRSFHTFAIDGQSSPSRRVPVSRRTFTSTLNEANHSKRTAPSSFGQSFLNNEESFAYDATNDTSKSSRPSISSSSRQDSCDLSSSTPPTAVAVGSNKDDTQKFSSAFVVTPGPSIRNRTQLDFGSPNGVDDFPDEEFGGKNYFTKSSENDNLPSKYKLEVERTLSRLEKLREARKR